MRALVDGKATVGLPRRWRGNDICFAVVVWSSGRLLMPSLLAGGRRIQECFWNTPQCVLGRQGGEGIPVMHGRSLMTRGGVFFEADVHMWIACALEWRVV